MTYLRHQRGVAAEDRALAFLLQQGLQLITRNYRCRFGEIDLIMRDGESLSFVEVRYRQHRDFGGAAASVALPKQKKLSRTAIHYLARVERNINAICRFDVIAIEAANRQPEWIKNAFDCESF